jgi:uncharacterized protein YqgV (UPF0045/DUF77 family)
MLVDLQATPLGRVRAVLRFDQPRRILVEFSINPVGGETPASQEIAQILSTIGVDQFPDFVQASAAGSQLNWNAVMTFATRCHEAVRSVSHHVITTVRIEDEGAISETPNEVLEATPRGRTDNRTLRVAARAAGHSFEL